MRKCIVCGLRYNGKGEKVSMRTVPQSKRKEWLQRLGIKDVKTKTIYICQQHFPNHVIKRFAHVSNGECPEVEMNNGEKRKIECAEGEMNNGESSTSLQPKKMKIEFTSSTSSSSNSPRRSSHSSSSSSGRSSHSSPSYSGRSSRSSSRLSGRSSRSSSRSLRRSSRSSSRSLRRSSRSSSNSSSPAFPSAVSRATSPVFPPAVSRASSPAFRPTVSRASSPAFRPTVSRASSPAFRPTVSRASSPAFPPAVSRASSPAFPPAVSRASSATASYGFVDLRSTSTFDSRRLYHPADTSNVGFFESLEQKEGPCTSSAAKRRRMKSDQLMLGRGEVEMLKKQVAVLEENKRNLEMQLNNAASSPICHYSAESHSSDLTANNAELFAKIICEEKIVKNYSESERNLCQAIYLHSHRCYEFMRKHLGFKLPTIGCLQKWRPIQKLEDGRKEHDLCDMLQ